MVTSKYRSQGDYVRTQASYEKVTGKSLTVQGEAYTIKELFERHMKGQLPNLKDESYWMDNQEFDSIDFQALRHADPYDKAELLQTVEQKAKAARVALEKWQKEQEEKEKEEQNVHFRKQGDKKPKNESSGESKDDAQQEDDDSKKQSKKG